MSVLGKIQYLWEKIEPAGKRGDSCMSEVLCYRGFSAEVMGLALCA